MNGTRFCFILSTLGPIGYVGMPGTIATLVTLPLVYALHQMNYPSLVYAGIVFLTFLLAVFIINNGLRYVDRYDDLPEIVLDEVIGTLIVFWDIPFCTKSALIGFLLFRFFDITKIGGIHYFQHFFGAWGILLDDVVAALVVNVILRMLLPFCM